MSGQKCSALIITVCEYCGKLGAELDSIRSFTPVSSKKQKQMSSNDKPSKPIETNNQQSNKFTSNYTFTPKRSQIQKSPETNNTFEIASVLAAGAGLTAVSKAFSRIFGYPLDRIVEVWQCEKSLHHKSPDNLGPYKGYIDVAKRLYKTESLFGLWRGFGVELVKQFPVALTAVIAPISTDYIAYRAKPWNLTDNPVKNEAYTKLGLSLLIGGISSVLVYPFSCLRLQVSSDLGLETRQYSSGRDAFMKILRRDGIKGFFRGFPMTIFGAPVYRGVYFGLYNLMSSMGRISEIYVKFLLAQAIVITASMAAFPFQVAMHRTMLQSSLEMGQRQYTSSFDALIKIPREEGIRALYRGFLYRLLSGVGSAAFLVFYDTFVREQIFGKGRGSR